MNSYLTITLVAITHVVIAPAFGQHIADTPQGFSFAFMTDVHIRPDPAVVHVFNRVVDTINTLDVDFVISGGDQVFDVMRGNQAKSDSLFSLYQALIKNIKVPVYHTVGNHELFGIYPESPEDSTHADYKYGMFERYFGNTYYSFDHKGWHFIVLNALDVVDKKYIGRIGKQQLAWLKADLAKVSLETPIAVTVHIPLVSAFNQLYPKPGQSSDEPAIADRDEVLSAFKDHRLKLVLQGHLHWSEALTIENRTHFITGGSVAGRPSWRGTNHGPRGFLKFDVTADGRCAWQFIAMDEE